MLKQVFYFLMIFPLLISCSEKSPTNSIFSNNNPALADTTEHLATNILTYFGGSGMDWGTSLVSTDDGGYIITGSTDSYGEGKNTLYLIKTDSSGKYIWGRIFGGSGDDNGEVIKKAPDGGYIIAGVTSSFNSNYDFYLLKVDDNGSQVWEKSIGTSDFEWGTDLEVLSDGYAICGYKIESGSGDGGDFYLVRTDLNGETIWSKQFIHPEREWPFAITSIDEGGFILAGFIHYSQNDSIDAYILKTDDTGKVIWEKNFGGSGDEKIFSIMPTSDGLVALGSTRSFIGGNVEVPYLLKIDNDGNFQWQKYYGEAGNCQGRDLVINSDGTIIFTGNIYADGSGTGLIKTDALGNLLWSERIGLSGTGMSIIRTEDYNYAITGFASDTFNLGDSDMLLMEIGERDNK